MALEALTAVGLAGNIVQFIDFGCNLLAQAREIHTSTTGSSDMNLELEAISTRLRYLATSLSFSTPKSGTVVGQQLRSLADEATSITDELLKAIEDVKLKGSTSSFKSFAHALQHIGKNKKIEKLGGKLAKMQGQLNTHLLVMLSDKHSDILKELRALEDENRHLGMNSSQNLDNIRKEILSEVRKLESKSSIHSTTMQDLLHSIERSKPVESVDLERLSTIMRQLSQRLCDLEIESSATRRDHMLLRSLCFKMMRARETKIATAHTSTFEWIFDERTESKKSTSFLDWLQNQGGVYWVMGKAGSGKSTLMKFLASHRRTRKELLRWAGTDKLITANFFFWNAGTQMQKSQEGLLRSLLFEILRQCPATIPAIFARWTTINRFEDEVDPWTSSELLECFSMLRNQREHSTRFCFFIDGLDEYEGESSDLIKALQDLSGSPLIKICASSRPWFVFKDAFGHCSMLRLEDLTRRDIASYVNDTLGSHPRFATLRARDARYLDLIRQIVDKAHGVFLWVFLVTVSLRRGLTNADNISDLQKRISLLPQSLEDYFRHILGSVEDVYRSQTAKIFQYALHAPPSGPIPLIVLSYLDEEDPNFALQLESRDLDAEEVEIRYEDTKRRLDGRTRGLLEASNPASYTQIPTVDFLHRTVRDFFLTKDMQDMLNADLEPGFDVDDDLCKAFLAQMKSGPWYTAEDCLSSLMFYLREVEEKTEQPLPEIVAEIGKIVCCSSFPWKIESFDNFLVDYNVFYAVAERFKEIPRVLNENGRPLLDVALRHKKRLGKQYLNPKLIGLLLRLGADPNESFGDGLSVWANFLLRVYETTGRGSQDSGALLRVLELLISHGADLEELVPVGGSVGNRHGKSGTVFTAFRIIQKTFPRDADWLLSKAQSQSHTTAGDWLMLNKGHERTESTNGGWLRWVQDKATLRS
ncbi:hypothetical protein K505DRAFT_418873 [Melanomma pulvis-pyrius CBS 109.77]|uniref:Uncharacterized protein n=1 Tax=Melanomma pulvis-pyrius CBS 109.77 TaxID=1314802 RepID=A0A6A6X6B2_9PLEO|nr:hypothetical protein K505DRAFT_418873 [Melanomma pulvis-pyrius CBS 109.77]